MKVRHIVFAAAALTLGTAAIAGPQCTTAPQNTWLPQDQMLRKLVDQGYTLEKFKVTDGNCYELYGTDKDGRKVEIYHNPVDGSVVQAKTKKA